jgi:hypothetical protein
MEGSSGCKAVDIGKHLEITITFFITVVFANIPHGNFVASKKTI